MYRPVQAHAHEEKEPSGLEEQEEPFGVAIAFQLSSGQQINRIFLKQIYRNTTSISIETKVSVARAWTGRSLYHIMQCHAPPARCIASPYHTRQIRAGLSRESVLTPPPRQRSPLLCYETHGSVVLPVTAPSAKCGGVGGPEADSRDQILFRPDTKRCATASVVWGEGFVLPVDQ